MSPLPPVSSGCSADTGADAPGEEEDTELTQDELSATARKLSGAWQDKGEAVRPPTFKGLVLNPDGTFFADLDTGLRIHCLPGGPCPDVQPRIAGRFTAGAKFLTLSPKNEATRSSYHGRYEYLLQGDKVSLSRAAWGGWTDSLSRERSYCKKVVDCGDQFLAQPRCVGTWSCGAESSCNYQCFSPPPAPLPPPCSARADAAACNGDARCRAVMGPSWCSDDGSACSRDFVFKSCASR